VARAHRNLNKALGLVVRRHRERAGLSQEGLAEACDRHRTYVSILERGLKSPSLDTIVALAGALGVRPHVLVKEAEEEARQ
jgi:transcriptional regulator with XRE-family HTH domain